MIYDRTAFVAGIVFVVIGGAYLLESFDVIDVRLSYVWPLALIAFGLAVLIGVTRPTGRGTN